MPQQPTCLFVAKHVPRCATDDLLRQVVYGPVVAPGRTVYSALNHAATGLLFAGRPRDQVAAVKREPHKITEHGCGECCRCMHPWAAGALLLASGWCEVACSCGRDTGDIKARETLTPGSLDKEHNREVEGAAGWTALGRMFCQGYTVPPAHVVIGKLQALAAATSMAKAPETVLLSSDVSGWSPTKDVRAEGMIAKAVTRVFSGDFMSTSDQVQVGYHLLICRLGLGALWPQAKGGYQGQDRKWSSIYHEIVSMS